MIGGEEELEEVEELEDRESSDSEVRTRSPGRCQSEMRLGYATTNEQERQKRREEKGKS